MQYFFFLANGFLGIFLLNQFVENGGSTVTPYVAAINLFISGFCLKAYQIKATKNIDEKS